MSTTASTIDREPMVAGKLRLGELLALIRGFDDPLDKLMTEAGFPPIEGGRCILPSHYRERFGVYGPPYFVLFSDAVEQPVFTWSVDRIPTMLLISKGNSE